MICQRACRGFLMPVSLVLIAIGVVPAAAQSVRPKDSTSASTVAPLTLLTAPPPQTGSAPAAGSVWEIEFHGGGIFSTNPDSGDTSLPPAGPVFVTATDRVSRRVSSYFLGDGAVLLNEVMAAQVASPRITALDPVLNSRFVKRQTGGSFGVRVTRRLTPRFGAELAINYQGARLRTTDAARTAIEASRASFSAVFNRLLTPGVLISGTQVTSTATFAGDDGRQISTTGALIVNLRTGGPVIPYATVGAGVISSSGQTPSVTLIGNYRFLLGTAQINETDTVSVRSSIDGNAFVVLFGGGIKALVSERLGVRVDARLHLSGNRLRTSVDAVPAVVTAALGTAPVATIVFGPAPALQMTNLSPNLTPSTLSGPALSNFVTFTGEGTQRQVGITAGVFFRF